MNHFSGRHMEGLFFPKDFRFGVSTSAYQIEGAYNKDGKGLSIWDNFCITEGRILNGDTGNIACDHYNRYIEDIELMRKLGIKNYRFSISWPRIFPDGFGSINTNGVKFYSKLVDELRKNEITPMATLFHWDLPKKLQDIGGWTNRLTCKYFKEYAITMFRELGDRVPLWITINEPSSIVAGGYVTGIHAPGEKNMKKGLNTAENLLIAHGMAVQEYRKTNPGGKIGIALNEIYYEPFSSSPGDRMAASLLDGLSNKFFLDILFKGKYPGAISGFLKLFGLSKGLSKEELEIIKAPMDFIGLNYYTRHVVKHFRLFKNSDIDILLDEKNLSDLKWDVYPEGLYKLLIELSNYTSIPIYITENGAAFEDIIQNDRIQDNERIKYIKEHILYASKAIKDGVNLKGYYIWSLLDNFEWSYGYSKRFGIIHVDFNTLKRTPKDSALWYRDFLKAHMASMI